MADVIGIRGPRRLLALALLALAAVGCLQPAAARADLFFGEYGEAGGQLRQPFGLDVLPADEDLFVVNRFNQRIEVFDVSGAFQFAFGWGVAGGSGPQTCTLNCVAGLEGEGAGQLGSAQGLSVDKDPLSPSYEDVYISERLNFRVQRFTKAGAFEMMIGPGVNKTTGGDVCTAASGDLCGAGDGSGTLSGFGNKALHATAGPGGVLYFVESDPVSFPEPAKGVVYETVLKRYSPTGELLDTKSLFTETGTPNSVAVDTAGDLYLYMNGGPDNGGIRKVDGGGTVTLFAADVGGSLSVDAGGNVFAADNAPFSIEGSVVTKLDPSGNILKRFGYETLASSFTGGTSAFASPGGEEVFVSERALSFEEPTNPGNRIAYLSLPGPGPLAPGGCSATGIGNTKATLTGFVNPEGRATTYHFDYLDQAGFEAEGWAGADSTAESEATPADFELHPASAQPNLAPETQYRCRLVATNADGSATSKEGSFETLPPFEVTGTWVSAVSEAAATLNASVNPFGIPASGYFEYVEQASYEESGFAGATRVPAAGDPQLDFGGGESPVAKGIDIAGLAPDTRYRYRVVVTDSFFPEGLPGPEASFRTPGGDAVPDNRRYEQVSPPQKNGANVAIPTTAGGLDSDAFPRVQAAALDGESATYTSFTSFGQPQGAQGASQYLSRRSGAGWATENITPPGFIAETLRPPFRGFTPDLRFSGVVVTEPPLTEDALEGYENLYLRDNSSGQLSALTSEAPQLDPEEKNPFCPGYAGASEDGRRAFFVANGAFAGAKEGPGYSLYEWSASGGLSLVSRLPNGNPATPGDSTFGHGVSGCDVSGKRLRRAISADGRRAFWTYRPPSGQSRLMARLDGSETIQLDAVQGGLGLPGGGAFKTASRDGARVFFTASNKLTADAGGNEDLYLYDFAAPEGERLSNLTAADPAGGKVKGLLGASEDGSAIYFAANGVLAAGAAAVDCGGGSGGECNLYLWREGEGTRFVARVALEDSANWSANPFTQTARVSADGRYLAFTSIVSLTGFDNLRDGAGGCEELVEEKLGGDPRCAEAFIYDAATEELICASCARSGARPSGPVSLGGWANPYEPPHNLSGDGSRLFFTTKSSLVPGDENEARDVYEFERAGAGSCTPANPTYVAASDGCVFLISGGRDAENSYLLGASRDGRDVFFSTRERLLGSDEDERYDLYDYRAGGGFPEPVPALPCADLQSCRPPAGAPPGLLSPATAQFAGPGNAKARPCSGVSRRARRLAQRARALRHRARGVRRRAARAGAGDRARTLRRRARRLGRAAQSRAQRADRLSRRSRRCRRAARGVPR